MSIEATPHGISSRRVRIAHRNDMLNASMASDIMLAVHAYVKEAHDFLTSPDETWKIIRDAVLMAEMESLLILYVPDGKLCGFMFCKIDADDPTTAVINSAYSRTHLDKDAVDESLMLFEQWAQFHKASKARFYTFRIPGSHKLMLDRGWKHVITSYKKELI